MRPDWEKGLRGRLYVLGRGLVPLSWRRAVRRRIRPERLLGIRKPPIDIPRYEFDPSEARPGRPDVLFLPVIAWTYRRQRPQQLAEALARRGRRVFYGAIEGPGEPREPAGAAPNVTLLPVAGVKREDPADRALEGRPLEAAFDSLARARETYELHEAAIVVQTPFWAPLALRLRERFGWKIVYDCLDEHGGFARNRAALLAAAEERLLPAADLAVATSEVLLSRLRAKNLSARLLPNACDYSLFAGVPDPDPGKGALTVGYVGAVDDWFDAPLFNRLARLRPDWRFEIVGGSEGSRRGPLEELPNVFFHGEKPHRELPAIRGRFDIEIVPFRLSDLTHAVDPVKVYEAFAAGRPVVATPLRSLGRLAEQELVKLASTAEDFAREIEAAAAGGAPQAVRRRAFARENTWDARAESLDSWIADLYALVSIVIVTHNGLELTRMCFESLDRRTDWPRYEIVCVDNGSTDGTREWLAGEARRRSEAFRLIAFEENRGFAPAVNAGVAASRGEYVCLLNNDTVATRGWLSALVRHLEKDPSLGMVSASTNEIANAAKVEVGYREMADLDSWARAFTRANAGRADAIETLAMFCVLLRRETYDDVGALDERFTVGMFEDDDYSRRLREKGLRLAVARDSFVHHWGRGTFRRLSEEEYLRIYRENRQRYQEKWASPPPAAPAAASPAEIARLAKERGAVFVFPPSIGWDITLVQRPHHLARALARRGFPVIFEVEESSRSAAMLLEEAEPRLFLHRGAPLAPLADLPGRVLWAFTYNVPAEESLAGARLVYDVIDHPDVFPFPKRALRENHKRALAAAQAVFAVSRPLWEELRRSRPDTVYLPNGVEAERFSAPPDPAAVPERLARSRAAGRAVAGYVGALARWVDADLLGELAALRPDWDFCLVGKALDETFAALEKRARENVFFLGRRPYAAIPSILAAFDAGLIPFRTGPEAVHASPIKLYEYLAAGLPVIATPIPECEAVPEVSIGRDARAFSDLLDRAAGSRRSPDFRRRSLARARENDWSRRAGTALAALGLR